MLVMTRGLYQRVLHTQSLPVHLSPPAWLSSPWKTSYRGKPPKKGLRDVPGRHAPCIDHQAERQDRSG